MRANRYAATACFAALLTACHSSGGGSGGGTPPPPAPTPQTYAVRVTGVEVVRAADQLALPVAGLPSQAGGAITVRP